MLQPARSVDEFTQSHPDMLIDVDIFLRSVHLLFWQHVTEVCHFMALQHQFCGACFDMLTFQQNLYFDFDGSWNWVSGLFSQQVRSPNSFQRQSLNASSNERSCTGFVHPSPRLCSSQPVCIRSMVYLKHISVRGLRRPVNGAI